MSKEVEMNQTSNPDTYCKITIQLLKEHNLENLVELHHLAYGLESERNNTIQIARWKFLRNNFPQKNIIVVGLNRENETISAYGSIMIRLLKDAENIFMPLIVAHMVHPQHRGRILYKETVRAYQELLKTNQGIGYYIGFPNETALKIGKRYFSYQRIFVFKRYVKQLSKKPFPDKNSYFGKMKHYIMNLLSMSKITNGCCSQSYFSDLQLQLSDKPPDDFDSFWERAKHGYQITTVRDREYVDWRFFQEPAARNEFYTVRKKDKLIGFFVLKTHESVTEVIDYFCLRQKSMIRKIFYLMMNVVKNKKSQCLRFRIHDKYIERLMLKNGFVVDDLQTFATGGGLSNCESNIFRANESFGVMKENNQNRYYFTQELFELG